jgi:hypothetical protein
MDIKNGFESLTKDIQEYLKRNFEDARMTFVEETSLMIGNTLASLILTLMLFVAFLFILFGVTILLADVIGFTLATAVSGSIVAAVAIAIYLMREKLFVNGVVKHMCRIFVLKRRENDREKK